MTRNRGVLVPALFAIAVSAAVRVAPARAIDVEKARATYQRLAKRLPERKIFYRWQSRTSGLNLLRAEEYTDKLYAYFMGMPFDSGTMHGGRGIYVAETIYTSSRFIRGDAEGSLIEVVLERGTPYLDLEDPDTLRQLREAGLTGKTEELAAVEPSLLVRYLQKDVNSELDWWVVKSRRGVKFQKFNPNRLSTEELRKAYREISHRGRPDQIRRAQQIFVARLTDAQREALGLKKTYFYAVTDLAAKIADSVAAGKSAAPEVRRWIAELRERKDELAKLGKGSPKKWSGILDLADWTPESLGDFLVGVAKGDLYGEESARAWLELLAEKRGRIGPALRGRADAGTLVRKIYLALPSYERNETFLKHLLNAGPYGVEDFLAYLATNPAENADFVASFFENARRASDAKRTRIYLADAIESAKKAFPFSSDQLRRLDSLLERCPPVGAEAIVEFARVIKVPSRFARLVRHVQILGKNGDLEAAGIWQALTEIREQNGMTAKLAAFPEFLEPGFDASKAVDAATGRAAKVRAFFDDVARAMKTRSRSFSYPEEREKWMGRIDELSPDVAEVKRFEYLVNDRGFSEFLLQRIAEWRITPDEYVHLFRSPWPNPNSDYAALLHRLKMQNLDRFLALNPTPAQKADLVWTTEPGTAQRKALYDAIVRTERYPNTFAEIVRGECKALFRPSPIAQ